MQLKIQTTATRKKKPQDDSLNFGKYFTDHMFQMNYDPQHGWHDPRIGPYEALALDPAAAVLHYGQALFEGLKAYRGKDGQVRLFRVDRHAERFARSAERLCVPPVPLEQTIAALRAFVRVEKEWVPSAPGTALYLRPAIIGTEAFLGVRAATCYTFFIIASPVGAYYSGGIKPLRLWVERDHIRAARGGLGAAKTGANYVASLLAFEQAKQRGYDQVLWLDAEHRNYLEEVGTMNACVVIADELITPPLEGSILAGVTRECVLALARKWGVRTSERPLGLDEVLAAAQRGTLQEIFGCGTAAVISPVGELGYRDGQGEQHVVINGRKMGPLATRLYNEITGIQFGTMQDPYGWLTSIEEG